MNQVKSNGASSTLFQHDRPNRPSRSKFDLSRITNFTLDAGMIVPFDVIPTLPNDDFRISVKLALDTLPLVQTSLTSYKVLTHWYYIKNRDLWKGWNTFITKGRSGNIDLAVPRVDLHYPANGTVFSKPFSVENADGATHTASFFGSNYFIGHHSLSSFLGVPPEYSGEYNLLYDTNDNSLVPNIVKDYLPYTFVPARTDTGNQEELKDFREAVTTGFGSTTFDNALPYVAYQNIVKHNYVNQNLLQNNKALFPDEGDDDWLLPYTVGTDGNNVANFISGRDVCTSDEFYDVSGVFTSDDTCVDLRQMRYAQYDDDYFTTGLPFLQRGDVTSLPANVSSADIQNIVTNGWTENSTGDNLVGYLTSDTGGHGFWSEATDSSTKSWILSDNSATGEVRSLVDHDILRNTIKDNLTPNVSVQSSIRGLSVQFTANQLRELLAMSVWQERNARCDGSYNRTIYQHWQTNPHSQEHLPIYIGGTCDYINFSTVIQNSQTSDNSHLGDTAGFGSTAGSSDVGTFHCDDYGFIFGIMIIKPNTTYMQGLEHFHFETTFEDYVQPEFEGLSPQAILNKELYVGDDGKDDDLFCYQERYTYLKVRQNVNRGLFQVKPDKDRLFGAFTQSRWFENRPSLSYQFLCMSPDNIRRDWLAYPVYPTFRCQILSDVWATRSLAYTSQPNTFGF